MRGIDVSKHQGPIDFNAVYGGGYRFVMVRVGYGHANKDPYADQYISQALRAGLAVGAYWFLYATNKKEAIQEADAFNNMLAPYRGKLTFPVAADYEYDSDKYVLKTLGGPLTIAKRTEIVKSFCDRLESYGWYVMVYANPDYIRNRFNWSKLKDYDLWLAQWGKKASYPYGIWQTGGGHVPGVNGTCDLDVSDKDYPDIIIRAGLNGFKKEETSEDKKTHPPDRDYLICYINDGDMAGAVALLNALTPLADAELKHGQPDPGEKRCVIQVGGAKVQGADIKIDGKDRTEVLANIGDFVNKIRR